jgi:hypothetical protein
MTRRDRTGLVLGLCGLFFLWLLSQPEPYTCSTWPERVVMLMFVVGLALCALPSYPHERRRR